MWNEHDRIVVVAAHPDDETIGLGGQLSTLKNVTLIHVTDGAPRSRPDWKEYAQVRRAELLEAASIAGIPADRCLEIGAPDQEASFYLADLAHHLSGIFAELDPAIIFTHPFEGGHPDHDATAFAVHHSRHGALQQTKLIEFSSYHRRPAGEEIETGCFLDPSETMLRINPSETMLRIDLDERQRSVKQRMFQCFASQQDTLRWFRDNHECFRSAPAYDFTAPAQPGRLF